MQVLEEQKIIDYEFIIILFKLLQVKNQKVEENGYEDDEFNPWVIGAGSTNFSLGIKEIFLNQNFLQVAQLSFMTLMLKLLRILKLLQKIIMRS